MLGDSLLVAPVFSQDGVVDYYLPEGKWTNFITGQVVEGRRWVREKHGYLSLPLMARPNTIIPVGADDKRPDYDYADGVTFHVFEMQEDSRISARVPNVKGGTAMILEASGAGGSIRVRAEGKSENWSILLRNVSRVQSVEGGVAKPDTLGTLVTPAKGVESLTINL
jgi:alpha-D-xyloside xylohydrolase